MRALSICQPLRFATLGGTVAGVARLATPDPREATTRAGSSASRTVDIDLGSVQAIDSFFLGYVIASAFPDITVNYGIAGYFDGSFTVSAAPGGLGVFRHYFSQLSAPVNARYIRFTIAAPAGWTAGVVNVGKSFTARWGTEYGGGRYVGDTGSATRLQGGGFAISQGVTYGGYQWTFGDLSVDETEALYLIQRRLGSTKTVLVVEDPDVSASLNERLHWGLMTKFSAYERLDPINTKWEMTVEDWL